MYDIFLIYTSTGRQVFFYILLQCCNGSIDIFQILFSFIIYLNSKKPNNLMFSMGRVREYTFFQRRHTNSQRAHEKVFDMTYIQRNTNLNHSEIAPHAC